MLRSVQVEVDRQTLCALQPYPKHFRTCGPLPQRLHLTCQARHKIGLTDGFAQLGSMKFFKRLETIITRLRLDVESVACSFQDRKFAREHLSRFRRQLFGQDQLTQRGLKIANMPTSQCCTILLTRLRQPPRASQKVCTATLDA